MRSRVVWERLCEGKLWKWQEQWTPIYRKHGGHVAPTGSSDQTSFNGWGDSMFQIQHWQHDSRGINTAHETIHPPITNGHIFLHNWHSNSFRFQSPTSFKAWGLCTICVDQYNWTKFGIIDRPVEEKIDRSIIFKFTRLYRSTHIIQR